MTTRLIIDSHHHLWDLDALFYPWLTDTVTPRRFGDYSAIRKNYVVSNLLDDTAGCNLIKSVHVQANMAGDPVDETAWLQQQADRYGFPHAIVAGADLTDPDAENTLARHAAYDNVRGIRVLLHWMDNEDYNGPLRPHLMPDPDFRRGFRLLRKYDFSFDLPLYYPQADEAVSLLKAFPDTPFVLNHAGFPVHLEQPESRRQEAWEGWCKAIEKLAEAENLHCKISGLWMAGRQLSATDIRPIVHQCLDNFSVSRCMFGSNFPLDGLFVRYPDMVRIYEEAVSDLSEEEKHQLFHDNAAAFYRI
jgi:predicted TIM-barrel fold metal-dependent hydrolase